MKTRNATRQTILAGAIVLSVLAFGASAASAAPAGTQHATSTCWKTVVNDWLNHQPNLQGTYPLPCYTQAIQRLSAYPDISQYSSAIDDIKRALLIAEHQDRGGPAGPGGGNNNSSGPTGSSSGGGNPPGGTSAGRHSQGLLSGVAKALGPGNAQSIPLPLLVLGGLALLLLLTAAATWLARRLQARRVTPAPAIAKRR